MVSPRLAASGFALAGVVPALPLRPPGALDSKTGMLAPVEKIFLESGDVLGRAIDNGVLLICARFLSCGAAASWLPNSRRRRWICRDALTTCILLPNVRAKRAPAAGCQARAVENGAPHRPGLVARRWRSA